MTANELVSQAIDKIIAEVLDTPSHKDPTVSLRGRSDPEDGAMPCGPEGSPFERLLRSPCGLPSFEFYSRKFDWAARAA